jgi:prepilin-type N-terminal cleavage/methylation domain-containing protein
VIEAIQRRLAARSDEEREGGFTLIELMVVVMIIAILVGIAIPAFLGARKRAQDTAAKSNLRNGLSTAQTIFTDSQAYLDTPDAGAVLGMVTTLGQEEPSLTFALNTAVSANAKTISVWTENSGITGTSGNDKIYLASKSASGTCYYLRHVATAANAISGTFQATSKTVDCSGDGADSLAATAWTPVQ